MPDLSFQQFLVLKEDLCRLGSLASCACSRLGMAHAFTHGVTLDLSPLRLALEAVDDDLTTMVPDGKVSVVFPLVEGDTKGEIDHD